MVDFQPLQGKLTPWFEAWRKGRGAKSMRRTQPTAMRETPGQTAWRLILTDDPKLIQKLEADYGLTQEGTVNDFIEKSCWTELLPDFVGGKGASRERLTALRAAYFREGAE